MNEYLRNCGDFCENASAQMAKSWLLRLICLNVSPPPLSQSTMTSAEKFFGSSRKRTSPKNLRRTNVAGHMKSERRRPSRTDGRIGSEGRFLSCIAVYDFGSGFKVSVGETDFWHSHSTDECNSSCVVNKLRTIQQLLSHFLRAFCFRYFIQWIPSPAAQHWRPWQLYNPQSHRQEKWAL